MFPPSKKKLNYIFLFWDWGLLSGLLLVISLVHQVDENEMIRVLGRVVYGPVFFGLKKIISGIRTRLRNSFKNLMGWLMKGGCVGGPDIFIYNLVHDSFITMVNQNTWLNV